MPTFQTVAKISNISPGEMKTVDLDGDEVAIANVGGTLYAFSNTCTHEGGPLGDGELEGETVTRPWHATVFSVRTGQVEEGVGETPVSTYEVRVDGDDLQLAKP